MISSDRIEKTYLALPVALRRAIPPGLKNTLRERLLTRWSRKINSPRGVRGLEAKLWGGFSASALADLQTAKLAFTSRPQTAARAAWLLARWYATRDDYATALENIVFARYADPSSMIQQRQFLLEAKFLYLLGQPQAARALIEARAQDTGFDASVELVLASTHSTRATAAGQGDEAAALDHRNAVFDHYGLTSVAKHDPARPLGLDNLTAAIVPRPVETGPLVTVIVPVYDAADTVRTALRGLAEQSWRNLEILVVDDASTDATADVVAGFCADDCRFRMLRQAVNSGSYSCRNRALVEATGDYVTVHDADDWSHPEKIALQAHSLARGETPSNLTAWSRTLPELMFVGTVQSTRNLISTNYSSYMIPRAELIAAGGWDRIRVTGDTELIWRIEALADRHKDAFRDRVLLPGCPLSFGRFATSSLTGTQTTHLLSIHHGMRREYRDAADHWHATLRAGKGRASLARTGIERFPAPLELRPERPAAPPLDLLIIANFNLAGAHSRAAIAMLHAGHAAGYACGILQYHHYDLNAAYPLKPEIRDLAYRLGIRIVAPGERVRARIVLMASPTLAQDLMDRFPVLDHDHLVVVVVVDQMAGYDPTRVRRHLVAMFGSEGLWVPTSNALRALMEADSRFPAPFVETWTPLLELETWCTNDPVWRGKTRSRPVIGRHGQDHPRKWPDDPDALLAAYCAGRPCETRFLGGAKHARGRLKHWQMQWPANWNGIKRETCDIRGFLGELDFFVHYPAPDAVAEFSFETIEAMAAGVPVVLCPELEPVFGAAALYAPNAETWPVIERLWQDAAAWEARVAAGRAFVRQNCSTAAFASRLTRLPEPAAPRWATG